MNIIFWNIRGIGNNDSRIALSDMCRLNRPSLIFIAEPMVTYNSIPNWYWRSINVTQYCVNIRDPLIPNLWAVWGLIVFFKLFLHHLSVWCWSIFVTGLKSILPVSMLVHLIYYEDNYGQT